MPMTANGQLASNQLAQVPGEAGSYLAPQTCADYVRLRSAALAAGFILRLVTSRGGGSGAYRPLWMQEDMKVNPRKYNLAPSPPAPPLAPLGFSRHGQGRAVDISNAAGPSTFRNWLYSNMGRFGFHLWSTRDPNHLEHGDALTTETGLAPASDGSTPLDNSERKRDHMDLIRVTSADNSYTEAILTDYVHTKVISPEYARNVMYCRKDIADKVNGFDAVVAASNYAALRALPPFPDASPSVSLNPQTILDAITAGDAQILAAIGQVDENTLATFGLKRV